MTPPTALILDEPFAFLAAQQHLARKGILAPEHISLVCCDPDPVFAWMRPRASHISWDPRPVTRRAADWVRKVAQGRTDRRQTLTKAEFVEGGTLGSPPP
jgi:DNA-binding LacI/PurR family transcriptional regulator